MGKSEFHAVSWAGVGFDVPSDWEMASVEGDEDNGYYRLDDPEIPRMEVRWERATPTRRIGELTDRYLRRLVKNKLLVKADAVRRDEHFVTIPDAASECFIWHGKADYFGMAMRCRKCARAILARIAVLKSEKGATVAKRIFGSVANHSCVGMREWAVLGFRFAVPEQFMLERRSLKTGRLDFEFRFRGEKLRALRTGVADVVLRKMSLEEWARVELKPPKKGVETMDAAVRNHPAREIRFKLSRLNPLARTRAVAALAFHCPESNALILAQSESRNPSMNSAHAFASSVLCH